MANRYTIDVVHDWINFITNKQQSNYFSHEEIDSALDKAQMWHFNEWKVVYSQDQIAQDALLPFKTTYPFSAGNTSGGLLKFPVDYLHFLGARVQYTEGSRIRYKDVKEMPEDEIAKRLDSQVRPVSATDPVGLLTTSTPVAETVASCQVNIYSIWALATPSPGDIITVNVQDPELGAIQLCSYTSDYSDTTPLLLATHIVGAINSQNTYGYSAANVGVTNYVKVTARAGLGATINGNSMTITSTHTSESDVFSGGVDAIPSLATLQFFPATTYGGYAYYLRRPAVPVYGYTQVGRVITYNPATSTQLEWNDAYITRLMIKALEYLSISVDDQLLTEITNAKAQPQSNT